MDTQDFIDTIQIWLSSYRDSKEVAELPDSQKTAEQIKWAEGMMKIASVIPLPESVKLSPANDIVKKVIENGKSGDRSKLKEIHDMLTEVEKYLGGCI